MSPSGAEIGLPALSKCTLDGCKRCRGEYSGALELAILPRTMRQYRQQGRRCTWDLLSHEMLNICT